MANIFTNNFKNKLVQGSFDDLNAVTVKVALWDDGGTYNRTSSGATAQFLADTNLSASIVGTAQTLGSKTFGTLGVGVFDAADTTFTAVTGSSVEALLLYVDTGSAATSKIIGWIDTVSSGLPVTPNGGNITIVWDATNGVFKIA